MRVIVLSIISSAVIGLIVFVFLRFVKYFDKRYDEFEDERYRAAAGPQQREHPEKRDEDKEGKSG